MGCFNESLRGLGCTIYNVTSKDLENHHTLEHVSRDLLQAKGVHGVLFVDFANLIITKQDANATYVYALRCATGDDIGTIFESPQFQRLHIDQLGYWAGYSRFCVAALHTYDEQSSRRGRDLSRPTEIILDPALPHSRVKPLRKPLLIPMAQLICTNSPSYRLSSSHGFRFHTPCRFAVADDNDQNGGLRCRFGQHHDLDLRLLRPERRQHGRTHRFV